MTFLDFPGGERVEWGSLELGGWAQGDPHRHWVCHEWGIHTTYYFFVMSKVLFLLGQCHWPWVEPWVLSGGQYQFVRSSPTVGLVKPSQRLPPTNQTCQVLPLKQMLWLPFLWWALQRETGLLLVGRVGERVVKTDMTVTKNFLVMVSCRFLCTRNNLQCQTYCFSTLQETEYEGIASSRAICIFTRV